MPITSADLSSLPPGTRTDLGILLLEGSLIEPGEGCLVVRSALQPSFHWGNCVHVTTGDVDDAQHWAGVFAREFPDADWLAIGLPRLPRTDAWQRLGVDPEPEDVLSMTGRPAARPLAAGYAVRGLRSRDDWDQLLAMDLCQRADDADPADEAYRSFCRERETARRTLIAQERMEWLGAFGEDGRLAASLGIVVLGDDRRLARYQSVLTGPEHRRRGLAGHLLGVAASWAAGRGAQEFVIVTEPDNPAGRLYRGVGFAPDRPSVQVYRPPHR